MPTSETKFIDLYMFGLIINDIVNSCVIRGREFNSDRKPSSDVTQLALVES